MIIVDTGAFLALFNRIDPFHREAEIAFRSVQESLITTYPVITETCYLLAKFSGIQAEITFLRQVASEIVEVFDLQRRHIERAIALMERYADLPMDFADASLVVLAEHLNHGRILTVDRRDFLTYRWNNTQPFENLMRMSEE
ncbi:MAG: PIN domain-containing protein [Aphanocapsa sp. GSE-SYN-MK-11-07L]|jgi:hypothetical protein|nr:PIN domain-containing protein [Aphanocapsa sp. GSE-SYN-MK-11-07L]